MQLSKPLCASSIPRKLFERTYGKLFLAFSHCKLLELLPIRWQKANGLYLLLTCSSCILFYFRFIKMFIVILFSQAITMASSAMHILFCATTQQTKWCKRLDWFHFHSICLQLFAQSFSSTPTQKVSHFNANDHTMHFPDWQCMHCSPFHCWRMHFCVRPFCNP